MALIDLLTRPTPEQVVRDHSAQVLAQLRRMFGPKADVDDVFQAVFVEVLRALPGFRGRAKLSTWIHRITLNVAYQEMRLTYRARATASLDEVPEPSTGEDTEASLARQQQLTFLYDALEALDPKKRMAVLLHDVEGMTLKEIAEHLGKPLQTVASQVRAGRAELAAQIALKTSPKRRESKTEAAGR